jgi:hypothetical protein
MTGQRMRWDKINKLRGRQTIGLQHDADLRSRDRAAKWIAAVERRQAQRRERPREWRSATQVSSV